MWAAGHSPSTRANLARGGKTPRPVVAHVRVVPLIEYLRGYYTVTEIAALLGVGRWTVHHWLSGFRNVEPTYARRISELVLAHRRPRGAFDTFDRDARRLPTARERKTTTQGLESERLVREAREKREWRQRTGAA